MLEFEKNREKWFEAGKKGRTKIINNYNFTNQVKKYECEFLNLI